MPSADNLHSALPFQPIIAKERQSSHSCAGRAEIGSFGRGTESPQAAWEDFGALLSPKGQTQPASPRVRFDARPFTCMDGQATLFESGDCCTHHLIIALNQRNHLVGIR